MWVHRILLFFLAVGAIVLLGCSGTTEKGYDVPVYETGDLSALYLSLGQECVGPQDCGGAFCSDGMCCTEACTGPCQTCELPGYKGQCLNTKCSYPHPSEWEFQEEDSSAFELTINAPTDSQQLSCFDDSEEKPCAGEAEVRDCGQVPYCGQDAQYATRSQWTRNDRFSEFEAGWILDQATQLYWKDTKEEGSWSDAQEVCAQMKSGIWLLPSRTQLMSLIVFGTSKPASPFPGIDLNLYWAVEEEHANESNAWVVDFSSGRSNTEDKIATGTVLCVRSRSAE